MAKLIIKKIKCFEQEDITGDDDIRMVVASSSGRRTVWSGSMDTDQVRNLGELEVSFTGSATIQLYEEDWPDGDDHLGSVTVTEAASAAVDLEGRFTGDGANYTVWYRVSTESDAPPDGGECMPPGPLDELFDWLKDLFAPWTGGSGGTSGGGLECPMGILAVEVKDEEGKPIQGAHVRLVQGGVTGVTDAGGFYDFGAWPEGTYTIEAKKEGYAPNPGSTTVVLAPHTTVVAQIVLSKVRLEITPKNDQRWYVNLPADTSKRFGREVPVTVQCTPAVAGVRVYFTHVYSTANRTGLPEHMQAKLSGPHTALTDVNGRASTTLRLSRYGGDKFQVKANLTPNTPPNSPGDVYTGWFHVWRRLFYEADCMTRPAGGGGGTYSNRLNRAGLQTEMDKVFIELVQTGADNSPAHMRATTDSEVGAWATALRTGTGQPRYFHLILMDSICVNRTDTPQTYRTALVIGDVTIQGSAMTLDPRDWFKSATYSEVGGGASGSLTIANFSLTVDSPYDTYKLRINLTGVAGINPTVKPVDVRIVLKTWTALSGLQTGPATILGMRWRERAYSGADITSSTLNTMLHEPAHAMGMAAEKRPDGTAIATTYYKNGHHCNNNANSCVMYEANSVSTAFCANCNDALKGRNLASLPQSGNAAY